MMTDKELADTLNSKAIALLDSNTTSEVSAYDALMQIAEEYNLHEVARDGEDGRRLYRSPEGHWINFWVGRRPDSAIRTGCQGFDTHTEGPYREECA